MRFLGVALWLIFSLPLVASAQESAGATDAGVAAPGGCSPDLQSMMAAVHPDEFLDDRSEARAFFMNDANGERIGIVAIGMGTRGDEQVATFDDQSRVSFVRCMSGVYERVYVLELPFNQYWEGTFTGHPGIISIESIQVPGVPFELLKIELLNMCGGVDPRFTQTTLRYVYMRDGELFDAFETELDNTVISGPGRDEDAHVERTVTAHQTRGRAELRVRVRHNSARVCRERYVWRDTRFERVGRRCPAPMY